MQQQFQSPDYDFENDIEFLSGMPERQTLINCQNCKKKNSSAQNLDLHLIIVHKILRYKCIANGCNKYFLRKKYLRHHFEIVHKRHQIENNNPLCDQNLIERKRTVKLITENADFIKIKLERVNKENAQTTINRLHEEIWNHVILTCLSSSEHNILRLVSQKNKKNVDTYYKNNNKIIFNKFWSILEKLEIMASQRGYLNLIKWVNDNLLWCINNNIAGKNYQINKNYPLKVNISNVDLDCHAAKGGHINILNWLVDCGISCMENILLLNAAEHGHLHVIKWLMKKRKEAQGAALRAKKIINVRNSYFVFHHAAISGNISVIEWLDKQKCDWNTKSIIYAVLHGHLHVLQWFMRKGGYK
jgi:hypothetical protein